MHSQVNRNVRELFGNDADVHARSTDILREHTENSATGTRTRVARVRAEYPNQLDYSGCCS